MNTLNLPPYPIKTVQKGEKQFVFDELRKKYVALTPEEWVRQHFVHYLITHKKLTLNGTSKRCDTVVYDKQARPRVIIEYKAPHIAITEKVFAQISRYNLVLRVDYLIVSNGMQHYCCRMDYANRSCTFLPNIPDYDQI